MIDDDSLREALRGVLVAAVESGPGAGGGIDSIQFRACAALYALLMAHPVDRWGRCRSCRRSGAVLGLRRHRCRVHGAARFWLLQQPAEFLRSRLVCELGLTELPPTQDSATSGQLGDTDVLPRVEPDPSDRRTGPRQTPVVSPPLPPRRFPRAGRPDQDHGGVGGARESPRLRRGPSEDPPPSPGRSPLLTGGIPWPS